MDEASGKDLHQHDTHFPNESQQERDINPWSDPMLPQQGMVMTSGGSCVHGWMLLNPDDDENLPTWMCGKCFQVTISWLAGQDLPTLHMDSYDAFTPVPRE